MRQIFLFLKPSSEHRLLRGFLVWVDRWMGLADEIAPGSHIRPRDDLGSLIYRKSEHLLNAPRKS